MDAAHPDRLSTSFGTAAVAYAAHRPDYAEAAVRWALAPAPGPRVLDLGAGTGKLTAGLSALGLEVIAVEPDDAMRAQLRRALPFVDARAGSAESIPLPDRAVDAVLCGNALHWFDLDVAGPEIARVLAPGGVLAGLWNLVDDGIEWVAGLAWVSGPEAIGARDTPASWRRATATLLPPPSGTHAGFGPAERAEFPHAQRRSADSLAATLGTRAGMLVLPAPAREERLAAIRAYLAGRPETRSGDFDLPLRTGVLRTQLD